MSDITLRNISASMCLCLALLFGCLVSTYATEGETLKLQNAIGFSDKDEIPASTTVSSLKKGAVLSYTVNVKPGGYAGFALAPLRPDISGFNALTFRIRLVEGVMPALKLQFSSTSRLRKPIALNKYLKGLGREWHEVTVPLGGLSANAPEFMKSIRDIAFVFVQSKGTAVFEFSKVTLATFDSDELKQPEKAKLSVFKKSPTPLPDGLAAWCYGPAELTVSTVKNYNAKAEGSSRIRYLFPWAGSVNISADGKASLVYEPERALQIARELKGDVYVLPMIDGVSHNCDAMTLAKWKKISAEIADKLNTEPLFAGVQYDLEPYTADLLYLYSETSRLTDKWITAASGAWSVGTFQNTDMLVLMGYDWASTPEKYNVRASQMIKSFISDAAKGGGKALIGIPAIATHHEYASRSDSATSKGTETGYTMESFVDEAMMITAPLAKQNSEAFVGYSIWAIHPDGGLHGPSDTYWYHPSTVSNEIWDKLKSN